MRHEFENMHRAMSSHLQKRFMIKQKGPLYAWANMSMIKFCSDILQLKIVRPIVLV